MELSLEQAVAPADTPVFTIAMLPPHSRLPGLALSLALHILVVVCTPALEELVRLIEEYSANDHVYVAQMVPLHASQPLYYYPAAQPAPPQAQAPPPRPAAKPALTAPPRARITLAPKVELPPLPEPPKINSIVIQPVPPNSAALLAALPPVAAWIPPNKPVAKPFVAPGRPQPAVAKPVLDAPPVLAKPNAELRISDLNIAGLPASNLPALPRPPTSTRPVRVFQPPERKSDPPGAGIGNAAGDPANLIVLGPSGVTGTPYVSVPAIVQSASAGVAVIAPPVDPKLGSGAGSPGSSGGAQSQATDLLAAARTVDPPMPATRIVRPKDGSYSFVVTGAAATDSFPETAGKLSGSLVYSVYLRTGARPDWILQYCLPRSASPSAPGGGPPAKLEAPYAFFMLRPQLSFGPEDDRLIVHGVLNEAGKFEQLELVGDAGAAAKIKEPFLKTLRLWEFRPASRDGRPTAVEVLLVIPRPEQP